MATVKSTKSSASKPPASKKGSVEPLFRFATYAPTGKRQKFYMVREVAMSKASVPTKKKVADHIIVVDRSGSMSGSPLEHAKASIIKVASAAEFKSHNLRLSLISYSDYGDCTTHFSHVSVEDVMAPGSKYLKAISNIRATCMTSMAQALGAAEMLVDDNNITVISLHTDGYANDPSPQAEHNLIRTMLKTSLKMHPNLIVNTVAHGHYADSTLLMEIANSMSGSFIQANDVGAKKLYDQLHKTNKLLTGGVAAAREISAGLNDTVVFVSRSSGKILGGKGTLVVNGLSETDDAVAYVFSELSEAEYDKQTELPVLGVKKVVGSYANLRPAYAYARVALAMGRINEAKYALLGTQDAELIDQHMRSLTSTEIANFAQALEERAYLPADEIDLVPRVDTYGLPHSGPSVLDVVGILGRHTDKFSVPTSIWTNYKRMGLKKDEGTRAKGTTDAVTPLLVKTVSRNKGADLTPRNFEINNSTPNLNMLTSDDVDLYENKEGGQKIPHVGSIPMRELKTFRNVTLVGSGELRVPQLPLRIFNKSLHDLLRKAGLPLSAYNPKGVTEIDLSKMPLVAYGQDFSLPPGTFDNLMSLTIVSKMLNEMVKSGESSAYSAEQIAELKAHCISAKLYYNPPTVNHTADVKAAIAQGHVDVRPSYEVKIGTTAVTSVDKLHSGNEVLRRFFTVKDGTGAEIATPTLSMIVAGATPTLKVLSKRVKITAVDNAELPIYSAAFGLAEAAAFTNVLIRAGLSNTDATAALDAINRRGTGGLDAAWQQGSIKHALDVVDEMIESIYSQRIRPLVFYIGANGFVPDNLNSTAYGASELEAKYPDVKLDAAESANGTFFVTDTDHLISVFQTSEYFTTAAGLNA